ncbi:putative YHS domain protein [Candidatus Nitrososphaera gargensis Ga9.2]|uniref:Putative YHS domain protein n=1 Tax=Nitrososphaera gargensis (strain Ga9.2) TaxID=1237085 RepID=K0IHQ9_NITGG|nr:YHS domain-containing protein [Candidatus Nitrososphaera gargensis]AFU57367.1 putative YHS domain protein [Candidatus Nitrososphaera gargensis Ga9.2]
MATDPVCGMEVDEKKAPKETYQGKDYYFCCPSCQWAFQTNPFQFAK